jgi:tripartite ATP-independent transporter DctM subunit
MATAVAMGSVSLPEMRRLGYSASLATGTVAIGGTLGILIPPSIPFIIYGILTETSISKLLIAGILPGILMATLYCAAIYVITTTNPKAGPQAARYTTKEKFSALSGIWPMLAIFLSIVGGIYLGIATPTEAAAIGAMGSLIFVLVKRKLTWQNLNSSFVDAAVTSIMMITILIGAMAFSVFMALTRLPILVAEWVTGFEVNAYLVLATILLLYIPLGCIMESLSMLILTIPLFFPTLEALGFSPILLGVLALRAIEIGLITPPVGLNVFVIKGVAGDVPISLIFKGIVPFLICDLLSLPILIAVPQISLFLPGLMK